MAVDGVELAGIGAAHSGSARRDGKVPCATARGWDHQVSGKGSAPRPFSVDAETFADNWSRIFSGRSSTVEQPALTRPVVGSMPAAPATYVNESGSVVPETWWPGDPAPTTTE